MAALMILPLPLIVMISTAYQAMAGLSVSFPLTFRPRSSPLSRLTLQTSENAKFAAKYSMALVVPLPVGTPAQEQNMVLDTGSQLSWVQCNDKVHPTQTGGTTTSFNPTVSSSFSPLSCNTTVCKPSVPDFTIPTTCDQKQLCYYSYFYADGTLAEGNLVSEKLALSSSPLILGCSKDSGDENGILGMNMGRLSVLSQLKITKFSYCTPARGSSGTGAIFFGENPNAFGLNYVPMMIYPSSQQMPNLDPLAYTVPMRSIRVGATVLNISVSAFRPDAGGSGQTIVDSGSEFTYLVDEAYEKVRDAMMNLVGPMMKKDFSHDGVVDMCFDADVSPMACQRIGGIGLQFDGGVEIVIEPDSVLTDVGDGVKCVAIGRSSLLGSAANIIGNVHQQNLWVEYDLAGQRIGFGKADCSRSYGQR